MHRAVLKSAALGLALSAVVATSATAAAIPPRHMAVVPAPSAIPAATAAAPAVTAAAVAPGSRVASDVIAARAATARYATDLHRAKADGYRILTRMIPNMGYHFINAKIKGFSLRHPAILVYEHHGSIWQLGALEWVFPSIPAKPPLPGARYGVFGAACHYVDGTFVFADAPASCAHRSPQTGAAFNFWHPRLITLHMWVWYPNPSGLYMGTNPLAAAFNRG